jgi:hypothetical protein
MSADHLKAVYLQRQPPSLLVLVDQVIDPWQRSPEAS